MSLQQDVDLVVPDTARGVVVFAHGSGSSRQSPRNLRVARLLQDEGFATVLADLRSAEVPELADQVVAVLDWLAGQAATRGLPVGLFGASTGAAAALMAAAQRPQAVRAVVSRGGRPDLAGPALPRVQAPTLLIVGDRDTTVVRLNEEAARRMTAPHRLWLVAGAGHLFEEPGTLDQVADLAAAWFAAYLDPGPEVFADRVEAGRLLGREVARYLRRIRSHGARPLVLALPRGGVPVGYEVAKAIDADLDVVVARKVGLPGQPELAVGAVGDDGPPVFNTEILDHIGLTPEDLTEQVEAERREVRRRLRRYRDDRPPPELTGRLVVVVDDGLATGATARAALRSVRHRGPAHLVFAAPVCAADTAEHLTREADGVVCARYPRDLRAIGWWYADFAQLADEQVDEYLRRAGAASAPPRRPL